MKNLIILIKSLIVLIIISLSFIGSDCNEIFEVGTGNCTGNQVDLIGNWKFMQNYGELRDICIGEIVRFNSDGTANLNCPNQNTITRNYTVSNNVLTYTETNMQYCISGNTNELQLNGINNKRILYYVKIITDESNKTEITGQSIPGITNSSELTK